MLRAVLRTAAAALVLLLAGAAAAATDAAAPPAVLRTLVRPGEKAPAFALQNLDGRTVSVQPGNDKPALVVFFSVFCPLCRELAPSVGDVAARCGGTLRVVGVNLDGKRFSNAVRSFVTEYGFAFPVLFDEVRDDMFLASDPYGVEKTPTAVLVDRHGTVRGSYAADAMRDFLGKFERTCPGSEQGQGATK